MAKKSDQPKRLHPVTKTDEYGRVWHMGYARKDRSRKNRQAMAVKPHIIFDPSCVPAHEGATKDDVREEWARLKLRIERFCKLAKYTLFPWTRPKR